MILFQNTLLLKEFLVCNYCFGLFTKIIKRSGICFCCTFSAWFFYKNVLYLILHLWAKFQCHLFSFSGYQTKCVVELLFRRLMTSLTFKIYLPSSSKSVKYVCFPLPPRASWWSLGLVSEMSLCQKLNFWVNIEAG